ncbi:hypothetical protein CFBP4996_27085 (plasmid) [Agrobacterium leguminum]|uniref:hypothetical protein n=1 Tax=Agrobacterium TaxID=357 RepID=UPI0009BC0C5D|nr:MULTISPECIES: hypothetical protein [Agrobacterium]WFS69929.1 hypothetical protein CFBP4996_27085 [Agrobacterium leguminum]
MTRSIELLAQIRNERIRLRYGGLYEAHLCVCERELVAAHPACDCLTEIFGVDLATLRRKQSGLMDGLESRLRSSIARWPSLAARLVLCGAGDAADARGKR